MTARLTVLIPCKNERLNIRACIEAARGVADEILVADSGSTDDTLDIVRDAGGCRIIEREFIGYADFKNWAIPQARHEWVLIVDADERLTGELSAEIHEFLRRPGGEHDGYRIRRRTFFLGREIKHSGWNRDTVTRLLRRDVCRYRDVRVHEEIDLEERRTGELRHAMLHYSYHSYADVLAKLSRYSRLAAQDAYDRGKRPSGLKLLFTAPLRFLQTYLFRLGFLDGAAGIQVCLVTAFGSFMKQAWLWELHHAPPQVDPEAARKSMGNALQLVGSAVRGEPKRLEAVR